VTEINSTGPIVNTFPRESFCVARSSALHQRARQSLATGVSSGMRRHISPVPLFFERGSGPYFFDADYHQLLDYTLGWGPLILGNNHASVNEAVAQQLSRAYTFGAQHFGEIELAELMVEVLPGVDRVVFSNTGTEAIQAAVRLARAYTARDKIVKFEGHYHGWLNNVLVSYRVNANEPCTPRSGCGGQPESEFADTLVLPWNDLAKLEEVFWQFPDQIACVLTEPLLANGGGCMPSSNFLSGMVDICRRHGALSIFDEVITGFRIALGGAREYFAVEPDLSVYGKALAAGFTLSAVGGKAEIFAVLDDRRTIHAGTYNGSPINLAAATATIKALRHPGTFERMHEHGWMLRKTIEREASRHCLTLVTSGVGSVFSVHFGLEGAPQTYRDTLGADASRYEKFRLAMLGHGVLLLPDGRWYVGAVHGEPELSLARSAIEQAMDHVRQ
jgi:glutamate-1-semialdehyde 2,1-aminomutase